MILNKLAKFFLPTVALFCILDLMQIPVSLHLGYRWGYSFCVYYNNCALNLLTLDFSMEYAIYVSLIFVFNVRLCLHLGYSCVYVL